MRALLEKLPIPSGNPVTTSMSAQSDRSAWKCHLAHITPGLAFCAPGSFLASPSQCFLADRLFVLAADERCLQLSDARSFTGADK